ncbi:MAG TPA: 1-(5-phosphoribosyl)-5-[(5-phosphoribosylamino)methylideneamino] imidazole-4-carboxamide isomerase [Gemmatimonadaceae bacterium]|jgi:phosphoribosylformimino-5-aminoimidazole carboxamide ribotide isomerase|nr:1-(5-phosphoribosyl)-5-[(5-phosphoribosylamino)methylideneamino] imidazole-4-carboxamide isomerase [Gemmatimonadaceae bacterium]
MIVIPAVDLREGACVQLVGGSYADERVRLDDPVAAARSWCDAGFRRLHVVDLDAATGAGSNAGVISDILQSVDAAVQVGGGVRDSARVDALLSSGAARVVVGTRAVEDPEWLAELADEYPGAIVLAADVRERQVVTHGWARAFPRDVVEFVEEASLLPLGGILVTAVHKEGQMGGTDLTLMEDVVEASAVPIIASGGVASAGDLRALDHRGVHAAVVGMALYTGALDPRAIAQEFPE